MVERIWEQTVDQGTYVCYVERLSDYTGMLYVERSGEEVMKEPVGLSYRALFGPDVADVAEWQERCIEAIDADYAERGEEHP